MSTLSEFPQIGVGVTQSRMRAAAVASARCIVRCLAGLFMALLPVHAHPAPAYVYNGPLLPLILQMPANGWLKVSANSYSDVWTPLDLEPLKDGVFLVSPDKIIVPWSGFAWDSNRGDLILYGGGHANYSGNDVYRWHSSTLQWERASLPSEIHLDPVAGFMAIDGVDHAPSSAHTYKNNMFFPIADRFLAWGGAAYDNGGPFLRPSEANPSQPRTTGPYLFDPNRANGNEVGGTTGSHVQRVAPHPEIIGGQMWQNRDLIKNLPGQAVALSHVNGCAAYANEGGVDVAYVAAAYEHGADLQLFRYQLTTLADPTQDRFSKVGAFANGGTMQTTCALDPGRALFVRTNMANAPFAYWDLTTAGASNPDHIVATNASIASLQSWLSTNGFDITNCGLEFDPVRKTFPLWCGGTTVWELQPPAGGNVETGWTAVQRASPSTSAPPPPITGVLGKWRYAPFYDVFVALENPVDGDVWVYKPAGWMQPNAAGNALPSVALTAPAAGSVFAPAIPITLTALASDRDGSIARVEYYANGAKVGQASVAPYTLSFNPILVGAYRIVAVAVDNAGGMTQSSPISVTVSAPLTARVLQRGLNGYTGVEDTYLDAYQPSAATGSADPLYVDADHYVPLVRFAIFQSEGGPVPDGAVLQSATLSLYKQYYPATFELNAMISDWDEQQATWNQRSSGIPWASPGAGAPGVDYVAAGDATVDAPFDPGWLDFDVTDRVQQWSNGSPNHGWRITQVDTGAGSKTFYSSEHAADATLRPKLTLVYSSGVPNPQFGAQFISQSVPTSMVAGQTYTASITLKNTGTTTWTNTTGPGTPNGYSLGSQNPRDNATWGVVPLANRVPVSGSVAPGATTTFTFNVVAPATAGTYDFQWQMLDEGVTWFGALTPNVKVTVTQPGFAPNAQFVSQSVPTSMVAGQIYTASIALKNTGGTTWTNTTGPGTPNAYSLGSQNPRDNLTWGVAPLANRVAVNGSVPPGALTTFTFDVEAPATAGTYDFQWQMVEEGVTWFGGLTPNVKVVVIPPGFAPNAQFVSQSVPAAMTGGQTYSVSITLKNTGNTTWTNTTGPGTPNAYSLGAQNPRDNFTWGVAPFPNRVAVIGSVAPGAITTFTFDVVAPATPGIYDFQWQMVDENVTWFGALTPNIRVVVP